MHLHGPPIDGDRPANSVPQPGPGRGPQGRCPHDRGALPRRLQPPTRRPPTTGTGPTRTSRAPQRGATAATGRRARGTPQTSGERHHALEHVLRDRSLLQVADDELDRRVAVEGIDVDGGAGQVGEGAEVSPVGLNARGRGGGCLACAARPSTHTPGDQGKPRRDERSSIGDMHHRSEVWIPILAVTALPRTGFVPQAARRRR